MRNLCKYFKGYPLFPSRSFTDVHYFQVYFDLFYQAQCSTYFREYYIQLYLHTIYDIAIIQQHSIYVCHLYSTVLQTVFLRQLFTSSSIYFNFKSLVIAGAVNAVSPANPFRIENSNIFLENFLNSELGSFIELLLIPKAQDAMTSMV